MGAKYIVSGQNLTIQFDWTLTIVQAQAIIGSCAELLYNRGAGDHGPDGERLFSTLSNDEKLQIVYRYMTSAVNAMAVENDGTKAAAKAYSEIDKNMVKLT